MKWHKLDKQDLMFDMALSAHDEVKWSEVILESPFHLSSFHYSSYSLSSCSFFSFDFLPLFHFPCCSAITCSDAIPFSLLFSYFIYNPSIIFLLFCPLFCIPFFQPYPFHSILFSFFFILFIPPSFSSFLCRCCVYNGEFKIGRGWWRSSRRCECCTGCYAKRLAWRRHQGVLPLVHSFFAFLLHCGGGVFTFDWICVCV